MDTTFMGLTLPLVSQTPGPEWASTINSDLSLIDSHNHTSGFGAPITTAALSIDADLDLNGFGLVGVNALTLSVPSVGPANASVYADSVGDMYWKNSAGNPVQITSGSSVVGANGTITGLVFPATAVYLPGLETFRFQSDVNKPAAVDHGPLTLRRNATGSYGVQIQPASGIAANWTLTLPAADPGATRLMGIVSGGQVGYVSTNSTLTLTGSSLTVATGGITPTQLATDAVTTIKILDGNVTQAKLAPKTVTSSSNVTSASTSSTISAAILGLSRTYTTTAGRVLRIECLPTGAGDSYFRMLNLSGSEYGVIDLYANVPGVGPSVISSVRVYAPSSGGSFAGGSMPVNGVVQVYTAPVNGTFTFYAEWFIASGGSGTLQLYNAKLSVYEL